jgi:RNA polymerase sigma-70 factor (ECF subfamily)
VFDVGRQATAEGRAVFHLVLWIARFKALLGAAQAGAGVDEETAAIEDPSDTPDVTLEKKQKGEVIRQCMTSLSVEHREIIDLVYYHEKSVEEVAEIVGIPEATVKTRMFYARKKLAELLKAQGIERGWP